ncbi:MAG: hypothetical protein HZA51_04615 [Planctomycetes bacterium]|nr:hypothetical protein [Planctomycetota bacterium]
MIQRAEDLASTIGPTWVSTTAMLGYYEGNGEPAYLIGDALATNAVTSEALVYYTFRILTYQTSTERGNIRGGLTYTARVVDQPVGANFQSAARRTIVRLTLGYSEWYGPLAAAGIYVWREVEFDEAGDVIEVRGDGDVSTSVS